MSPPSRRRSLILAGEERHGRSASRAPGRFACAARLASVVCVGSHGSPRRAPSVPRPAIASCSSSPPAPRHFSLALSCSRSLDFSASPPALSRSLGHVDASPSRTPVHGNDEALLRTPPSTGLSRFFDASLTIEDAQGTVDEPTLPPLFVPRPPPLLADPQASPRPARPAARRKTLAGVTSFNLPRSSPRLQLKNRKAPMAKLAQKLLYKRLGIVAEGEMITEVAINKFVAMFQGKLPGITIAALRALFRLDCDLATAVEDALIAHGGEGALDQPETEPLTEDGGGGTGNAASPATTDVPGTGEATAPAIA